MDTRIIFFLTAERSPERCEAVFDDGLLTMVANSPYLIIQDGSSISFGDLLPGYKLLIESEYDEAVAERDKARFQEKVDRDLRREEFRTKRVYAKRRTVEFLVGLGMEKELAELAIGRT